MITIEKVLMNIAEPIIRIEKRLESLVDDVKKLKEDMNKVIQSLDNLKKAMNKHEEECVTKEHEKKYRAFTNEEFLELFDLGKLHSIRLKDGLSERLERLIITDIYVQGDYLYIKLNNGDTGYSPAYLFDRCEYFDGEWKPFGKKDD